MAVKIDYVEVVHESSVGSPYYLPIFVPTLISYSIESFQLKLLALRLINVDKSRYKFNSAYCRNFKIFPSLSV